MAMTGNTSWRLLAAGVVTAILGVVMMGLLLPGGYAVAGYDSIASAAYAANTDIGVRLAVPHLPSFLPSGVAEHPGLHNVPLRIAVESGLVAAGVWVGITLFALIRKPFNPDWWILLTLGLLSMLDYYTWMGHLGGVLVVVDRVID